VTGGGRDVPASRASRICGHGSRRSPGHASPVLPSSPGLPPCRVPRLRAARSCPRAPTRSLTGAALTGVSWPEAPTDASPLRATQGRSSGVPAARLRSNLQGTLRPSGWAFRTRARPDEARG
jgi:hypothetical protein